jgi:hypothetical protein
VKNGLRAGHALSPRSTGRGHIGINCRHHAVRSDAVAAYVSVGNEGIQNRHCDDIRRRSGNLPEYVIFRTRDSAAAAMIYLRRTTPPSSEITNKTIATQKSILAPSIAVPATPPNPRAAAIRATTRKTTA